MKVSHIKLSKEERKKLKLMKKLGGRGELLPPSKSHKTEKDYNRKREKEVKDDE